MFGFTFGGGYADGLAGSGAITVAVDTSGKIAVIGTPEIGLGGGGPGIFFRQIVGPGSVDGLKQFGVSGSATIGKYSGSLTLPGSAQDIVDNNGSRTEYGFELPLIEYGWGLGEGGALTGGWGYTIWESSILGDIGSSIGIGLYEYLHPDNCQ